MLERNALRSAEYLDTTRAQRWLHTSSVHFTAWMPYSDLVVACNVLKPNDRVYGHYATTAHCTVWRPSSNLVADCSALKPSERVSGHYVARKYASGIAALAHNNFVPLTQRPNKIWKIHASLKSTTPSQLRSALAQPDPAGAAGPSMQAAKRAQSLWLTPPSPSRSAGSWQFVFGPRGTPFSVRQSSGDMSTHSPSDRQHASVTD